MPRAVHHQKCDQPAAAVDHGERDLAAELVGFGHSGLEHFEACFLGEPVRWDEIRHVQFLVEALLRMLV